MPILNLYRQKKKHESHFNFSPNLQLYRFVQLKKKRYQNKIEDEWGRGEKKLSSSIDKLSSKMNFALLFFFCVSLIWLENFRKDKNTIGKSSKPLNLCTQHK